MIYICCLFKDKNTIFRARYPKTSHKNNKYPKAFLANPSSRLAKNDPARARKKSRSRLRDAMNKRLAPAVAATTISPIDGQPISAPAANVNKLAIGSEKATTAV